MRWVHAPYPQQRAKSGFWADLTFGDLPPNIWRMRERVFIGAATEFSSNRGGAGGAWLPNAAAGASWGPRDSQLAVMQSRGGIAIAGLSRASDNDAVPISASAIGVAGFTIVNSGGTRSGWGLYSDVQFESGRYGYGLEVAVKNKGGNRTSTPYFPTVGTYGIWLHTGDNSYGGTAVNPANTAIAIGKNATTWNRGIIFFGDGLTRDGFNRGRAVSLGYYHHVSWYDTGNHESFYITSGVATAGKGSAIIALDDAIYVFNGSGAAMFQLKFLSGGKCTINGQWPTSASGLATGDLWNNNGVLTVVA